MKRLVLILLCAIFVSQPVVGQPIGSTIPIETFFKREEFANMQISPKGNRLAALVPHKGRNNLVVVDLEKRTRQVITGFDSLDAYAPIWVNNDRLMFFVSDAQDVTGRFNYKGAYAVDHDGSELRELSKLRMRNAGSGWLNRVRFLVDPDDGTGDTIVSANFRRREASDVFRLNTKSGKIELLTFDAPADTDGWVLDSNNVARAVSASDSKRGVDEIWYRSGPSARWVKIFEGRAFDREFDVLTVTDDNRLVVSSNINGDRKALYFYDPEAKKFLEPIAQDDLVDIESRPIRLDKKMVGVRYERDRTVTKWFDPTIEALQRSIDKALPSTTNSLTRARDNKDLWLVSSVSATDAGRYHLFNAAKNSMETLPDRRSWLKPQEMPERKFLQYRARDGLLIPAYLTLPRGVATKNLPLVVNIHGGPHLRAYQADDWGRWPDAQFLASRGYAVLEPEPRGGRGFGHEHLTKALGQWGLSMQDDITDGALHLVKEGIVDKGRMCLFGGSYGGYASLQGLIREPDLFKCAVSTVAVTDLDLFRDITWSDIRVESAGTEDYFNKSVGKRPEINAQAARTSPLRNADKIKGAVLLAMGGDDVRVPVVHGNKMRDAMVKAGVKHEYVVYPGEGHGFNADKNVHDFYSRVEKFLASHLQRQ
jgi:dipeptidyl aminopeptidase/acylaminoacyl peptidase